MNKLYRLYSRPSFFSGAARLVDLGGTFNRYRTYRSPQEADARAIAEDWHKVGEDMRMALVQFRREHPQKQR